MNTLSVFAKNDSSEKPKNITKMFHRDNVIGTNEEVVKCWSPRDKYDLFFTRGNYEHQIVNIFELDNGLDVVVMTDDPYLQENDYYRVSYKDFIDFLKVTEIRVLFKGDMIK